MTEQFVRTFIEGFTSQYQDSIYLQFPGKEMFENIKESDLFYPYSDLLPPQLNNQQLQSQEEHCHGIDLHNFRSANHLEQQVRPLEPILLQHPQLSYSSESLSDHGYVRVNSLMRDNHHNTSNIAEYPWIHESNDAATSSPNYYEPATFGNSISHNSRPSLQQGLLDLTSNTPDDGFGSYFPKISTDLSNDERLKSFEYSPQENINERILREGELRSEKHLLETYEQLPHQMISELSIRNILMKRNRSQTSNRVDKKFSLPLRRKTITNLPFTKTGSHTTQPGPIPASEPKLKIDQENGDELLSFSYSKQKIITNFVVRCPAKSIEINDIPHKFKVENCVYPRAMVPPEEYKGNRGKYERECNEIGWRLSWYNVEIRNHRGLIQRAVDSWRNTRSDKTIRSRRVRKYDQTSV